MPTFRKKPLLVEAVQFNGLLTDELADWAREHGPEGIRAGLGPDERFVQVRTEQDQWILVKPGEWIIRDRTRGRFYPCDAAVFEATYEAVDG